MMVDEIPDLCAESIWLSRNELHYLLDQETKLKEVEIVTVKVRKYDSYKRGTRSLLERYTL